MTKIERWKPEDNQKYYFVSNMLEVIENNYAEDCEVDRLRYKNGNCFKTQAEAEAAAEKVKALLLSLHEPVTNCNQLPKLTAEVFNHPDCPEWAKYAAVDSDGDGFFYEEKPRVCEADGEWLVDKCITGLNRIISGDFTPYDWQNSLIARPAKLPEWCKVGEWVYSTVYKEYVQISDIDEFEVALIGGAYCSVGHKSFLEDYKLARLRPYTKEEMRGLVGKVIEVEPKEFSLCLRVKGHWADFLDDCDNEDDRARIISYNCNMLKHKKTLNGKPCGVLEHLEDGEWVK